MVLFQIFVLCKVKIDMDNICVCNIISYILLKGFKKFGFSRTSNTSNDLNIGNANYINQLLKILVAIYQFHGNHLKIIISSLFPKINIFSNLGNSKDGL